MTRARSGRVQVLRPLRRDALLVHVHAEGAGAGRAVGASVHVHAWRRRVLLRDLRADLCATCSSPGRFRGTRSACHPADWRIARSTNRSARPMRCRRLRARAYDVIVTSPVIAGGARPGDGRRGAPSPAGHPHGRDRAGAHGRRHHHRPAARGVLLLRDAGSGRGTARVDRAGARRGRLEERHRSDLGPAHTGSRCAWRAAASPPIA